MKFEGHYAMTTANKENEVQRKIGKFKIQNSDFCCFTGTVKDACWGEYEQGNMTKGIWTGEYDEGNMS